MTLCLNIIFVQVSYAVTAIMAGATSTLACNDAIVTIQSIVGDLEVTAMFCSVGALSMEGKDDAFSKHKYAVKPGFHFP